MINLFREVKINGTGAQIHDRLLFIQNLQA